MISKSQNSPEDILRADIIHLFQVVLVFITRNYVNKVTGDNASDNCKLEFNHAGKLYPILRRVTTLRCRFAFRYGL